MGDHAHSTADPAVAQAVRVFVQNNLGVKITIASRTRAGKDIHLDPSGRPIRRRGKIRIVDTAAILGVRLDRIIPKAAPPEVVALKIPRLLSKAQVIQLIMHPIAPIEKLHDRCVPVPAWIIAQIQWEIENTKRRTMRTWQIRLVVSIQIRVRVHVVAESLVDTIVDPTVGGSIGVQRTHGEQTSRNQRWLVRCRCRKTGRKWRRAVARENAVGGVADVLR